MIDILGAIKCNLRGLWWSLKHLQPFSGHIIQETEVHKNCEVIIGKCEDCGKSDISWQK